MMYTDQVLQGNGCSVSQSWTSSNATPRGAQRPSSRLAAALYKLYPRLLCRSSFLLLLLLLLCSHLSSCAEIAFGEKFDALGVHRTFAAAFNEATRCTDLRFLIPFSRVCQLFIHSWSYDSHMCVCVLFV